MVIFKDIAKRIKGGLEVFTDPTARREAIEGVNLSIPSVPSLSQLLDRIEPIEKVRFRDVAREIPSTVEKGVDLFQDLIVRFPARAAGSITLGVIEELTPGTSQVLTPTGEIQKFFFGEEELKSVQLRSRETTKAITDFGISPEIASGLSLLAIGGLTGLDLLPFGGSKKVLAQQLLKTRRAEEALSILGKLGVPDDLAKIYAPKFVDATKIKAVEKGLKSLGDIVKTTKVASKERIEVGIFDAIKEFSSLESGVFIKNPNVSLKLGKITSQDASIIGAKIDDVGITRRAIKHIVEQRGERAREFIESIPDVLTNPSKIADNSIKRPDSFLFAKMNGEARGVVLEITKTPDGNRVVSAFPIDRKTFRKLRDISGRPEVPPSPQKVAASEISARQKVSDDLNIAKIDTGVKGIKRRTLEIERSMQKAIRSAEIAKLKRTGELQKLRQRILDRTNFINRGIREGSLAKRKDILRAGNELKAALKEAKVSSADAKWFTDTFKNIKGTQDLAKKMPELIARVERLNNAREVRTLKKDIIKEIKKAKPKIGQKKALEGKFGPEAQKQLDFLRGTTSEAERVDGKLRTGKGLHIKGNRKKALNEIEDNINKVGVPKDGVMPDVRLETVKRNALLNMVGIQNMSVAELRNTLRNLRSLKNTGQLEVLRKQSNKTAELEIVMDTAKKEFRPPKARIPIVGEVTEELNPVVSAINAAENIILSQRNLTEKLTFGKEFQVSDWLANKIRLARNGHGRFTPKWGNLKINKFKEIFGEKDLKKIYKKLSDEKLVWKGKDVLGKKSEIRLSQFEAAYWWALAKDPTNIPLFQKNMNFSQEMFKAIDNFLSPEMKKYTAYIQDEWLKGIKEPVNERYITKFGMEMPNNPNYMPRMYGNKSEADEVTNLLLGDAFPNHPSTVPSGVKTRIGSTAPFRKISIEMVTRRHLEQMNQFIHFDEAISDARRVFVNLEVKEVIFSQKGGKQTYDTFINKLDDIARGGMAAQMKLAGIDRFISTFTKSTLMFNFVPFLKQLTSFPAFTLGRQGISYTELASGARAYYMNPTKWTKLFAESDFIFGRLTKGFNRETALAFKRGDSDFTMKEVNTSLGSFLKNAAITPTRGGDMVPILPGMTAKYLQVTKQLKTTQLSKEAIHKRALAAAEDLASRTQQSPFIEDQGRIQTANSLGKIITMYATTPIQFLREGVTSPIRMWNRGQLSAKDTIRSIITAWVILPQLFQFTANGFTWNNEKQLQALALGPIDYYPAAGDLMGTLYDAFVKGEDWKSVASAISPLFSVPEDAVDAGIALNKIMTKNGDMDEWMKFAEETYRVAARTTGLPTSPITNIKGITDLIQGDTKDPRRLIFSEFALEGAAKEGIAPLEGGEDLLDLDIKLDLGLDDIFKDLDKQLKESLIEF